MSEDIAQRSLALLKEERELFDIAMALQARAIESVAGHAPITEDGLRAAVALTCYSYDMLLCGWNSLIRGFYAVAVHSVRTIDQATVTALAATLDPEIARKFWKDKLNDVDAAKALQKAISAEDADFGEEWGERRTQLRKHYHKFMHPSRTAIGPSIVIAADFQSAMPTFGGFFFEKQCKRIGKLYADLAFKAAIDTSQAFKTVLPPEGEFKQQLEELVEWGKPLIDSWEKEMGLI
jgi:hypothetical protein